MPFVDQIVHCRTKKPLELTGSVAIVGNSDQLACSNYGEEIDAHDLVFRFNLASLAPEFQSAIGSRADFYLLSQNITTERYPHPEPLQSRFRDICRGSQIICYPNHTKNVMKYCKRPYLLVNDVPKINASITALLGRPPVIFPLNNHPRNGVKLAVALMMAGVKPTLYGFDLEPRENAHHYYDDEVQIEVPPGSPGHRPSLEFVLLDSCRQRGLLNVRG